MIKQKKESKLYEAFNENKTLNAWANDIKCTHKDANLLYHRLYHKWKIEEAIITPKILLPRLKHGLRKHPLYNVWKDIHKRCNNPRYKAYKYYGGKGIIVCQEWNEFQLFYDWGILNGYQTGLEIDRINSNGNYEPSNCKWSTRKEQNNNTSKNLIFEIWNCKKSLSEIIQDNRCICKNRATLYYRIKKGWSIEKAITTPINSFKNKIKIIGIISGFFNPIGGHHIDLIIDAKSKCDYLIAIVNNDKQVNLKGSINILNENDRVKILKNIKGVDEVHLSTSNDNSVNLDITYISLLYQDKRIIFMNGGSVSGPDITRETETCKNMNIEMQFGIGGFEKNNSSSWMIQKVLDYILQNPGKYGFIKDNLIHGPNYNNI